MNVSRAPETTALELPIGCLPLPRNLAVPGAIEHPKGVPGPLLICLGQLGHQIGIGISKCSDNGVSDKCHWKSDRLGLQMAGQDTYLARSRLYHMIQAVATTVGIIIAPKIILPVFNSVFGLSFSSSPKDQPAMARRLFRASCAWNRVWHHWW